MTPRLRLYADQPGRRTRQIVMDLLVVVWVVVWVRIGLGIHQQAASQGQGAQRLEKAGTDFAKSMTDAGAAVQKLPLVGAEVKGPFDRASAAGTQVAQAGRDIQVGTDQLGQLLGALTAALPIGLVVGFWLLLRLNYARKARLALALENYAGNDVAFVRKIAGLDLASLGLRAQPSTEVVAVAADRDEEITEELAPTRQVEPADESEPEETIEISRRPDAPAPE